jgi:hypothetical protein
MPMIVAGATTASHPSLSSEPSREPVTATQSTTRSAGSATAQPSAATAVASRSQQQAALTRMLAMYARDQQHGVDGTTLSSLGKQIMAAAKALGQHVTLPRAPAGRAGASTAPSPVVKPESKINMMA